MHKAALTPCLVFVLLSAVATGCLAAGAAPDSASTPQMSYADAMATLNGFRGRACPAGSFFCGAHRAIAVKTIILKGNSLVLEAADQAKSLSLPIFGMKMSWDNAKLTLDNKWKLTTSLQVDKDKYMQHLYDAILRLGAIYAQLAKDFVTNLYFPVIAERYRSMPVKPTPGEKIRELEVQAVDAVRHEQFTDAANLYNKALGIAPWWPQGNYNLALILAELHRYHEAILNMQHYLRLVPDAPNARQVQDKIYVWKRYDPDAGGKIDPDAFLRSAQNDGKPHLGAFLGQFNPSIISALHLRDNGAFITYVAKDSVADQAGIRAEDVVVSFAGKPVANIKDLVNDIHTVKAGTSVPISIVRGDQNMNVVAAF